MQGNNLLVQKRIAGMGRAFDQMTKNVSTDNDTARARPN